MRTNIIIAENFYEDPAAVREYALTQRYYYPYESPGDVESGAKRLSWMSSWFKEADECPFKKSEVLIAALEHLTGDTIDRDHWNRGFPFTADGRAAPNWQSTPRTSPWNCCFHLKPAHAHELGEGVHNHVTDIWNDVGENGWFGLIYFNSDAPLRGGLKLWENVEPSRNYDWMTGRDNWKLVDDLGNVCNRLILCRGNLPHSGAAGWGSGLQDGRLFQTFFFQVKDRAPRVGLRVALPN